MVVHHLLFVASSLRSFCMLFAQRGFGSAVKRIAGGAAVAEPRPDIAQVAFADCLTTKHTIAGTGFCHLPTRISCGASQGETIDGIWWGGTDRRWRAEMVSAVG